MVPNGRTALHSASVQGRQLGSYRIDALLGAGGMGEVYRAFDEKLQRTVAVKVLPPGDAADLSAGARLLREARAAAALNHPHICTIHEVGEHEGRPYIAMELVEGAPLDRVVPAGSGLPTPDVLKYGLQIADALAHAHDSGVLHRDLKSPNIVITRAGRAKVLDFGLAKRVAGGSDATTEMVGVMTVPGTLLGTPAYMAPEQLRGATADARTDLWALGVVLHEMAAGARPFDGQTAYELSASILNEPAAPLPDRVPNALRSVIARCLEKNPADRFQSAAEVRDALEAAGDESQSRVTAPPRGRSSLTHARLAGAAAIVLLVAAGVAIGLNVGGLRDRWWTRAPLFDSLAVLPLRYTSGDPAHAYLAGGVQQALITELSQMDGLTKVVAAASTRRFEGSPQPPSAIASALGVRALVTGSVVRTGDHLRVEVQLVDGATERQIWGNTYERRADELVALQNETAAAIAAAIEIRPTPRDRQRAAGRAAIKPETYELYLRGMHELNGVREGADRLAGLRYLQQAIDNDPGDPHAYAGLAKGYATLGHSPAAPEDAWTQARSAAERALTLAPDLADAQAVMADVKLYYEWDWAGAERAFRRANELNPNLAMNRYHYAWYLFLAGRLDDAIREHERARDLDPMTPLHTAWLGDLYRAGRRFEEAIATAKKCLELNPSAAVAWSVLSHTYADMGRHEEAIAAAQRAVELGPPQTFVLGIAYQRAGRHAAARGIREAMESRPKTSYGMFARSVLYLHLGDADAFFDAIAHKPHHAFVPWVYTMPELQRFKHDPRYEQLIARLKLPVR